VPFDADNQGVAGCWGLFWAQIMGHLAEPMDPMLPFRNIKAHQLTGCYKARPAWTTVSCQQWREVYPDVSVVDFMPDAWAGMNIG
jgi:hypothetical protein